MFGLAFQKRHRLLKPKDFQRVFDQVDCKQGGSHFTFLSRLRDPDNLSSCHRLGLIISKRNVPKAVDRNYIKRVVRESFRHNVLTQHQIQPFDVVVLAKPSSKHCKSKDIHQTLNHQWLKLNKKIVALTTSEN